MSRWPEWSGREEWTWGVRCPEIVSHLTVSCFYPPCAFFISWVDLANFGRFYLSEPLKICSHPQNGIKYALSSGPRGCVWSFVGRQNFLFSSHNFETIPLATLATFFINHICKKHIYYCQPTELLNTLETCYIFTHVYNSTLLHAPSCRIGKSLVFCWILSFMKRFKFRNFWHCQTILLRKYAWNRENDFDPSGRRSLIFKT